MKNMMLTANKMGNPNNPNLTAERCMNPALTVSSEELIPDMEKENHLLKNQTFWGLAGQFFKKPYKTLLL